MILIADIKTVYTFCLTRKQWLLFWKIIVICLVLMNKPHCWFIFKNIFRIFKLRQRVIYINWYSNYLIILCQTVMKSKFQISNKFWSRIYKSKMWFDVMSTKQSNYKNNIRLWYIKKLHEFFYWTLIYSKQSNIILITLFKFKRWSGLDYFRLCL